jgi:sugar/nucleoside kinase (ribokinase family)
MSLLVVGSMAYDSVETPFGAREEVLGGSATFFSTSASFFTQVRAVAVVGEDFDDKHLDFLRTRGVDLAGVSKVPGRTFRWKGRYSFQLNEAQTLDTQLNVFQSFSPTLPESYRDSEYVFLGNIHPELQAQVVEQVRSPKLIAMDTMNFWIQGSLPALKKTLARVDLLFVNDGEARQLAGEHNIVQAARAILAMGPKRLVIKRGEYGALLFDQVDHADHETLVLLRRWLSMPGSLRMPVVLAFSEGALSGEAQALRDTARELGAVEVQASSCILIMLRWTRKPSLLK